MFNKINKKIVSIFTIFIMFFAVSVVFSADVHAVETDQEIVGDSSQEYFKNTCIYVSNKDTNEKVKVVKKIADDFEKSFSNKIFQKIEIEVTRYSGTTVISTFDLVKENSTTNCSKYIRYIEGRDSLFELNSPVEKDGYVLKDADGFKPVVNNLSCNYVLKDIKNFEIKEVKFSIHKSDSLPMPISFEIEGKKANYGFYTTDGIDNSFTEKLSSGDCPKYLLFNPDEESWWNPFDSSDSGILMSWDSNVLDKNSLVGCWDCAFKMGSPDKVITYEYAKSEEEIQKEVAEVEQMTSEVQSYLDELNGLNCEDEANVTRCNELKQKISEKSDQIDTMCKEQFDSSQFEGRTENCDKYLLVRSVMVSAGIIDNFRDGCSIISRDLRDFINWILGLVKIAGPIIVIVMGSLDFAKAAASSEADANKKAFDKLTKRLMMAVIIFLIPSLIQFVFSYFDVFNIANGLEPSNPFCL